MPNSTLSLCSTLLLWLARGSAKRTGLITGLLLLLASASQAQNTYYWRGTNNSWVTATNWCTSPTAAVTAANSRATPATNDILIFDGNYVPAGGFPAPVVINYAGSTTQQTIGELRIINGANVTLSGPTTGGSSSTLNVSGGFPSGGAADFLVDATSSLTIYSNAATNNRFLLLKIGTGKTGLVAGALTFNASNTSRLVAADEGALVFSGATSSATVAALTGAPFGTTGATTIGPLSDVTAAQSVVFKNGATFTQQAGDSPFGPGAAPVAAFETSTRYVYSAGSFASGGQTYGNLEFAGANATVSGPQPLVILNNLTVTAGQIDVNVTGTGTTVGGNLLVGVGSNLNFTPPTASALSVAGTTTVDGTVIFVPTVSATSTLTGNVNVTSSGTLTFGGAVDHVNLRGNLNNDGALAFTPNANSTVAFNGTAAQSISGSLAINFGTNALLEINNPASVTLALPVTVRRGLFLNQGLLNTSRAAGTRLTMPASATVTGGSSTSYVNGYMARQTQAAVVATAPLSMVFPVGKNGNYRPFTLNITTQSNTGAVTYVGEQMETPPAQLVTAPVDHVSYRRYYQLAPSVVPTGFSGTVTLTFGTDDFVNYPADPDFVMAKNDAANGPWGSIGRSASTGTANGGLPVDGSLTSAAFSAFATGSNFSLASTAASVGFPGVNPLPVELTRFAAAAKGNGIALDWATASEKNSAYFEVQRSADNETFWAIDQVRAQGSSAAARAYAVLDRAPRAGLNYYRLRQVDADGKASFSPVVSARWSAVAAVELYPNPSSDKVYLRGVEGPVRFRVFTEMGKTLLTGGTTGAAGLDVQALPAGMYLLELTTGSGRTVQRFARQ